MGGDSKKSAREWLGEVREAERGGDFLGAYDLARHGLEAHSDDLWLRHRAVLNLARSGATDQALALFETLRLSDHAEEDIAALRARIEKDRGLAGGDTSRAAELYAEIYKQTGGYYPGINAATLRLLAGDADRAADVARSVLEACETVEDGYYRIATQAEAALLLGDLGAAQKYLERARAANRGDHAALATTRRQLRLICDAKKLDTAILDVLKPPNVAVYSGHMIRPSGGGGSLAPSSESAVAERIAAALAAFDVGYAYGSLACGADILFVEALLKRGAEVHVVLPFRADEFKEGSVARGGEGWIRRFDACLKAATSVTYATEDSHLGDDLLFTYASQLAMGLAILRARFLDTGVEQLAVWDGKPARGAAGTAVDVSTWRALGRKTQVIPCGPPGEEEKAPAVTTAPRQGRVIRAMLFGDVKGFSRLEERHSLLFLKEVLGSFGDVLDRFGADVLYRNTWGDGLYVVFRDAAVAARGALGLQRAMASVDLAARGLPTHLALRVGAHVGPVFEVTDPVVKRVGFVGAHVSRTARIEPVTPEGHVYVTEPFAARLALDGDINLECDYVGRMPAAKGYGVMRMYVLKERGEAVR